MSDAKSNWAEQSDYEALHLERDWTPAEEAKAKRKLDLTLMPLLMLGFFCLQLDRGNISNALTDNFMQDVGITQNQFNVGQQMLSLGIVLLEIPANMALYAFGPGKWLSSQVVAFGLVSMFQAFQHGLGPFIATRLLLGLAESGYIPGGLYTLSTWYTKKETAKRVMIFFVGNLSASASSNLIAYGILQMRGIGGKPGWFWLFVIMGLFTIVSGFVLGLFLPDSVQRPKSFLLPKLQLFTPRELHILKHRVLLDDPHKFRKKTHISLKSLKSTLSNWHLYPHVMITLLNNAPLTAFGAYTPVIISSFGFESIRSNAFASIGLWVQIPVALAFSYVSDHFNIRGTSCIAALTLNLLFMTLDRVYTMSDSRDIRYVLILFTQVMSFIPHPLNVAWMALTAKSGEERAIAMAMAIMAANAAGIAGAQIFRSDDRPRYRRGLSINAALIGGSLAFAIFQAVYLKFFYKRNEPAKEAKDDDAEASAEDQEAQMAPKILIT